MSENASIDTDALFTLVRIGSLELSNRVVMAPMTRNRAGAGDVPQPIADRMIAVSLDSPESLRP